MAISFALHHLSAYRNFKYKVELLKGNFQHGTVVILSNGLYIKIRRISFNFPAMTACSTILQPQDEHS